MRSYFSHLLSVNGSQIYSTLVGLGYSGALPDMLSDFLSDQGYTGSLNDKFYSWFADLGYSGAMPDKWYKWKSDGFSIVSGELRFNGFPVRVGTDNIRFFDGNFYLGNTIVPAATSLTNPDVLLGTKSDEVYNFEIGEINV